jgi:hypothetical protein
LPNKYGFGGNFNEKEDIGETHNDRKIEKFGGLARELIGLF